jgi:hypothetical protein
MHHLYVESVIIYSQHSDISIKTGMALRLGALFFIYFSFVIYLYRPPTYRFFTIFSQNKNKNKHFRTIIYSNLLSFRSLVVAAVSTAGAVGASASAGAKRIAAAGVVEAAIAAMASPVIVLPARVRGGVAGVRIANGCLDWANTANLLTLWDQDDRARGFCA